MTTKKLRSIISDISEGEVFKIEDLNFPRQQQLALAKALSRMVEAGELQRLSSGSYYKPKQTPFGILAPAMEELFKDLLFLKGKPIGYLTGYYAFNLLGLTTQQPTTIEIATQYPKRTKKRGIYTIRFVQQKNEIKKDNIDLLRLLDCLKWIKKIPDTSVEKSYSLLEQKIRALSAKEKQSMVQLSLVYSPVTRALLGAMLEKEVLVINLKETLNPFTQYKLGLSSLSIDPQWQIL